MAYPDARFYLHTTSFDKVIAKEKRGYKLLAHPVFMLMFLIVNVSLVTTWTKAMITIINDFTNFVVILKFLLIIIIYNIYIYCWHSTVVERRLAGGLSMSHT